MAPEMINLNGFNYVTNQKSHKFFSSSGYNGIQTDIFALGVILFSLLVGRPPFKIADINDPFYRLIFTHQISEFWAPWDQFAVQNNVEISQDFKDLFIALVTFQPLMRLSINEILSSRWMQRNLPTNEEVFDYMTRIKARIDELENQQKAYFAEALKAKAPGANKPAPEDTKEETFKDEFEDLNDSSLSGCSQINDDDELIMKDLQDIESEFYANNDLNGSHSFNLGEDDDFDVDAFTDSKEFDGEKADENHLKDGSNQGKLGKDVNSTVVETPQNQDRGTAIVQFLEGLTEVDTEVRTTVPQKMLSFLEQYAKLKNWKIVKISNYVLLKIPESSECVVEYVLKFDQVDENHYALKYLKYDEMSFEQFHSVGSFILDLLSPYC